MKIEKTEEEKDLDLIVEELDSAEPEVHEEEAKGAEPEDDIKETDGKPRARKKKKGKGGKIWLVLIVLCLCVLGFSGYQLMSILMEYKAGTDEYEELQQTSEWRKKWKKKISF